MSNNMNNLNNNDIDYIIDSICDLLIDSAKQIGCFHATNRSNVAIKSRNIKTSWFNQFCRHKRNMFFAAKRNHNNVYSDLGNLQLKYACKEYKSELNLQLRKYKKHFQHELRRFIGI